MKNNFNKSIVIILVVFIAIQSIATNLKIHTNEEISREEEFINAIAENSGGLNELSGKQVSNKKKVQRNTIISENQDEQIFARTKLEETPNSFETSPFSPNALRDENELVLTPNTHYYQERPEVSINLTETENTTLFRWKLGPNHASISYGLSYNYIFVESMNSTVFDPSQYIYFQPDFIRCGTTRMRFWSSSPGYGISWLHYITRKCEAPEIITNSDPIFITKDKPFPMLNWTITDLSAGNYTFSIQEGNGVFNTIESESYISGQDYLYQIPTSLNGGNYTYKITATDINGRTSEVSIPVIVYDTTLIEASDLVNITYHGPNYNLTWIVFYNYEVNFWSLSRRKHPESSFEEIDNGTFISPIPIVYEIADVSDGSYEYLFRAFDDTGALIANDTTSVSVRNFEIMHLDDLIFDTIAPDHTLNWEFTHYTDSEFNGTLFLNDTEIKFIEFTSSLAGTYNLDYNIAGFKQGSYNFHLLLFDENGGSIVSELTNVNIKPDKTPPQISTGSSSISFLFGENYSVSWAIADLLNGTYEIKINNQAVNSGDWFNGEIIEIYLAGLAPGNYIIAINASDEQRNFAINTIEVDIIPFEFSRQGRVYNFNGKIENFSLEWYVVHNETNSISNKLFFNGSLVTGVAIINSNLYSRFIYNVSGLEKGAYFFNFTITDAFGNGAFSLATILVSVDTIPPIIHSLGDIIIELNPYKTINWNVTDLFPGYHNITINGQITEAGGWFPDVPIIYSLELLPVGTYTIKVDVIDYNNNTATNTMVLTIIDQTKPIIHGPSDLIYEFTEQSFYQILWQLRDFSFQSRYEIRFDGILVKEMNWTVTATASLDLINLTLGIYSIIITAIDFSDNIESHEMTINIRDTTIPSIQSLSNFTVEFGDNYLLKLNWNVTELLPNNYSLLINGQAVINEILREMSFKITYNFSVTTLGVFEFHIRVTDSTGNLAENTFRITILDTAKPSINAPSSQTFEFGSIYELELNWIIYDLLADSFEFRLTSNDINEHKKQYLTEEETVFTYEFKEFTTGTYNFTLTAVDGYGNLARHSFIIIIQDTVAPLIQGNGTITIKYLTEGHLILWSIYDLSDFYYNLSLNSEIILMNSSSKNLISVNYTLPVLQLGINFLEVSSFDISGNNANFLIQINNLDRTKPIITANIDKTAEFGFTKNISFTISDSSFGTYGIYMNKRLMASGNWDGISSIREELLFARLGAINITIQASDISGNRKSISFFITGQDTIPPVIVAPTELIVEYGVVPGSIHMEILDETKGIIIISVNGFDIYKGFWAKGFVIDYRVTQEFIDTYVGAYYTIGSQEIIIAVTDLGGNRVIHRFKIIIQDSTEPVIEDLSAINSIYQLGISKHYTKPKLLRLFS